MNQLLFMIIMGKGSALMSKLDVFNSKILLFGEYSIIKGSRGLAVPLKLFHGKMVKDKMRQNLKKGLALDEFCLFLKGSSILSEKLDLLSFHKDINEGMIFDSNIPQGYGVGSSGALCAAIYAKYAYNFERKDFYSHDELKLLKDMMALMESFYHGSSSGIDCLISLIDKPLLIEGSSLMTQIPNIDLGKFGHFSLLDSGMSRKTSAFVHEFLNQYENNKKYQQKINKFKETTNEIIDVFSNKNSDKFLSCMQQYSLLQYECFQSMIPKNVKVIWEAGLNSSEYYLKLCGAGGGGYFLVYSPKRDIIKKLNLIEII